MFDFTAEQLTDPKYAVHSPRFNHTKDKLVRSKDIRQFQAL